MVSGGTGGIGWANVTYTICHSFGKAFPQREGLPVLTCDTFPALRGIGGGDYLMADEPLAKTKLVVNHRENDTR